MERVMRWQFILEEYAPELIYLIKGKSNIVAKALNRLELETPDLTPDNMYMNTILSRSFSFKRQ
jgi:hypothetical protein